MKRKKEYYEQVTKCRMYRDLIAERNTSVIRGRMEGGSKLDSGQHAECRPSQDGLGQSTAQLRGINLAEITHS